MNKREIIKNILSGNKGDYVPWSIALTQEARDKIITAFGDVDIVEWLDNHIIQFGNRIGFYKDIGDDRVADIFGAVWDRSIDKDIGVVENLVLPQATLKGYEFPDPLAEQFFQDIKIQCDKYPDRFRAFDIGFSLYERAWILRGMTNLMMDFFDNPLFVHELFNAIADYNIAQIHQAVEYDIDAVYFGDDWGQQQGLQIKPQHWFEFVYPALKRMYTEVKKAGKFIIIHSCGKVDELFDDLIDIGVNCFNPFQPEVIDVKSALAKYRTRLTFFGGLSTQKILPFGNEEQVRKATRELLEWGKTGGLIFSPAHAVEGDVPIENIAAMLDELKKQPGYC